MAVRLMIKNAPDDIAAKLLAHGSRNQRSLQEELLALLKAFATETPSPSPAGLLARIRKGGLKTPAEMVRFIRADRGACTRARKGRE